MAARLWEGRAFHPEASDGPAEHTLDASFFSRLFFRSGLIGRPSRGRGDKAQPSTHTSPHTCPHTHALRCRLGGRRASSVHVSRLVAVQLSLQKSMQMSALMSTHRRTRMPACTPYPDVYWHGYTRTRGRARRGLRRRLAPLPRPTHDQIQVSKHFV